MYIRFFGQYLINHGLVTIPQLVAAFEYQHARNRLIGAYGIESGQLCLEDVSRVLALQSSKDITFGQAAIELGILSEGQLDDLLLAQEEDHIQLGNALSELGYLDRDQVEKALTRFIEEQAFYAEKAMFLPEEVKDRSVILRFFEMTQKMLLRKWALQNKPIEIRIEDRCLLLSDHNVRIGVSGDWSGQYILAVPIDVTTQAAQRIVGTEHVTDEERDDLAAEFANVVCGQVIALLAEIGKESMITTPEYLPQKLSLSGSKAVVLSLVSGCGLIFVSIVY